MAITTDRFTSAALLMTPEAVRSHLSEADIRDQETTFGEKPKTYIEVGSPSRLFLVFTDEARAELIKLLKERGIRTC